MNLKNENELEQLIHRELRQLPPRKAPSALALKVMAAIQAQARLPWWQRTFWAWPASIQVAFLVLFLISIGLISQWEWVSILALENSGWSRSLETYLAPLRQGWDALAVLFNATGVVVRAGLQPVVVAGLALLFLMYLCGLGAGTILARVARK